MTLTTLEPPQSPQPARFTRAQYYQMGDLGFFQGRRVELIEGEIVEVAPQKNPHFLSINLVAEALRKAFGDGYWVRVQGPLHLQNDSEPEPDVAVVAGPMKSYEDHPTSALLVVEVSDTTLRYDRGRKASLYARAGIADYWIVNLVENRLEIMRDPTEDATAPLGWRYSSPVVLKVGEQVSPLALPAEKIAISDLLP
jgi:Uma2 family endonuclease